MAPNLQLFVKLVGNAFTIAVVGFAIAISLGKIFGLRHGYRVDSNQVWGMGQGTRGGNLAYKGPQSLRGESVRRDTAGPQTDVPGPCGGLWVGEPASLRGLPQGDGGWGRAGPRHSGTVTRHCQGGRLTSALPRPGAGGPRPQ